MIIDNAMAGNDFMDRSRVTMKQLEFRITNEDGKIVPNKNIRIQSGTIMKRLEEIGFFDRLQNGKNVH